MMDADVAVKRQSNLKSIALPSQHGAWGFLFEPIILGLLVAPSWVGLLLGAAIVGTFLIQRPLVIVVKDLRRKRRFERTRIAMLCVLVFASIAFLLLALTVISVGIVFVPPLILALPLALTQLWYEARNQGRRLISEVAGALALGAAASMIALAADTSSITAYTMWLVIGLRAIPSTLYVRVRLRLKRSYNPTRVVPVVAHVLAFVSGLILYRMGILSGLYLAAAGLLFVRAIVGLGDSAQSASARTIGLQEIAFGLLYVMISATAMVGYYRTSA